VADLPRGNDDATPHEPSGVAIDSQGSIYVVDTGGSRIEKLSPSGRLLLSIGHVGTDQERSTATRHHR